jgi:hypothetical protein
MRSSNAMMIMVMMMMAGKKGKGRLRVGTKNFHRLGLIPTTSFLRHLKEVKNYTDEGVEALMSAIGSESQLFIDSWQGARPDHFVVRM